ncbi:hypothetical protein HDU83_005300 [Entophlyctis luteolus]|nr:hypothetical protein HDU83_005300 [Entophlyctis luteolus]
MSVNEACHASEAPSGLILNEAVCNSGLVCVVDDVTLSVGTCQSLRRRDDANLIGLCGRCSQTDECESGLQCYKDPTIHSDFGSCVDSTSRGLDECLNLNVTVTGSASTAINGATVISNTASSTASVSSAVTGASTTTSASKPSAVFMAPTFFSFVAALVNI